MTAPTILRCTTLSALLLLPLAAAAEDAAGVLNRAAKAMGADTVKTLKYTGGGMSGVFGQAYIAGQAWPKMNVSAYSRDIDYDNSFIQETQTISRAEPKGGGAVPLSGPASPVTVANAATAWNMAGTNAIPRPAGRILRLHDLWTTPHGALKAAMTNPSNLEFKTVNGKSMPAVTFTVPGITTATAYFGESFLVERVESRLPDQVMGDVPVVTTYSEYRDYGGGVQFPARIEQTVAGFMTLQLIVTGVQPNVAVKTDVPDNVAKFSERVTAEKAADGVWFLAGGSHNSVAVEMSDHIVLIESPLDDGRAAAVFAEVKKTIPGKPIRFVVNSHNHFDHSGGLRYAVSQGAAIVTQAQSKAWFEKVFANPNRIAPDSLAKSPRKANIVGVADKMVMNNPARTIEIHKISDTVHGDAMLMVYLPKEKLLIEADVYTPGPPDSKPIPAPNNGNLLTLVKNIDDRKLAVDRILPLHGRMVPVAELTRAAGK